MTGRYSSCFTEVAEGSMPRCQAAYPTVRNPCFAQSLSYLTGKP
jgi:hypothetical protein